MAGINKVPIVVKYPVDKNPAAGNQGDNSTQVSSLGTLISVSTAGMNIKILILYNMQGDHLNMAVFFPSILEKSLLK